MRAMAVALLAAIPAIATAQSGGWKALHANEFQTPWTTFRIGAAVIWEVGAFEQDSAARRQVLGDPDVPDTPWGLRVGDGPSLRQAAASGSPPGTLPTTGMIRDSRFILGGRLSTQRRITWQAGLMYDWIKDKWFIRQTGFVVDVPEIHSNFWIGRTKEGPSLNRVTVGYDTWMMERFTWSDAAIPLLADGIRWQGYIPKSHLIWNLGYFIDVLSEGESFSYFSNQLAGRIGFVRMDSDTSGSLFHAAIGFHFGIPNEGSLRLKAKPEANGAPNFIDTGQIPATATQMVGLELYYRPGPLLFGTEYYLERAASPQTNNPAFNGGGVFALWNVTGEVRRYIAPGSYFDAVSPRHSIYHGGSGGLEVGLHLSNIDLDDAAVAGGKFWRLTPIVNWHLSDNIRLEFEYGYGTLDRYGMRGHTQFYQSRIQLQL